MGRTTEDSCRGKRFLFCKGFGQTLGSTQPCIEWVPEVERLGCEVDHSPPFSADVNKWCHTSTHPYAFVVHRDNFTLLYFSFISSLEIFKFPVFGLWNYFALLFTHAVMFFVVFEDL
jgi:hypothetical protein